MLFRIAAALVVATPAAAQIGTPYCTANANSTGSPSAISASGSTDVTANDVTLQVTGMPTNSLGYFITSQMQGFVMNPAGSSGNLCVVGSVGRYAGNILNSGASGSVSLALDLTSIPAPTMSYAAMAGDTVNFQLWHRDTSPMGPTSNFSPGLEIQFDAAGPTFQNDIWPMLDQPNINAPSCTTCHGNTCNLDMPDPMTAYNNLVNGAAGCCIGSVYVIPGDAANSLLYDKLLSSPNCGSQMPFAGTFAGDPQVIFDWIQAGAPF